MLVPNKSNKSILLKNFSPNLEFQNKHTFQGETDQSKKDGKDQESVQSSTTPDPGYHMGK